MSAGDRLWRLRQSGQPGWLRQSGWRALALFVALALLAVACDKPNLEGPVVSAPAVPTPTPLSADGVNGLGGGSLEPTTPGLSDELIRLGVVADIAGLNEDNAVTSGSEAAWLAMKAWEVSVNERGGLAGRNVEVVLFDANVFDHRGAVREACASDIFALVGSYALGDGNGVDLLNAPSCRLPDFPAAALSPDRRESEVTFVSNPTSNLIWNAGPAQYLQQRFGQATNAVATVILDLPVAFYQAQREIEAATSAGYVYVHQATADVVDQDYDDLALELQSSGAQAVSWTADGQRMLQLLDAWVRLDNVVDSVLNNGVAVDAGSVDAGSVDAGSSSAGAAGDATGDSTGDATGDDDRQNEPGNSGVLFQCGADCYSQDWAEPAGQLSEDVWVSINMLPFEEAGHNVELVRYVLSLRELANPDAELNLVGLSSWASALLFEEAVNRARFLSGGGLTRELVIEAANTITEWDGQGLHGLTNPAEGLPSSCFMLVTPTTSGWIRRHPATAGTMDCESDNLVELTESATLGLNVAGLSVN